MNKNLVLAAGTLIGGVVLCGFGLVSTLKPPLNTICIVGGLVFSVGGFIAFILILKKR